MSVIKIVKKTKDTLLSMLHEAFVGHMLTIEQIPDGGFSIIVNNLDIGFKIHGDSGTITVVIDHFDTYIPLIYVTNNHFDTMISDTMTDDNLKKYINFAIDFAKIRRNVLSPIRRYELEEIIYNLDID